MPQTAIAWLILYVGGLATSLVKGPFYGLITYTFAYYTQNSWAKGLPHARWSLYAAMVVAVSYIFRKSTLPAISFKKMPQLKWMVLIFINMLLHIPFAPREARNLEMINAFFNIMVTYYLVINILTSKLLYRIFMWMHIWGNYLWGWQGTFHGKMVEGRLEKLGGPGTKESNQLAGQLLLILPFLANRVAFGHSKLEKLCIIWSSAFIVNILILCRSRGAFLGLAVMTVLWIIFSKGHRIKTIVIACLGIIAFLMLTDPAFWTRMTSIQEYQSDDSSMSRLHAWSGAVNMLKDYPLGVGGGGFKYYSPIYAPQIAEKAGGAGLVVHNTFLQTATEWGVQGLALFLLFIAGTIRELHKIRRRKGLPDDEFYHAESKAIQIGLIGILVASFFINRFYTEMIYIFCGLSSVIANLQQSALLDQQQRGFPERQEKFWD